MLILLNLLLAAQLSFAQTTHSLEGTILEKGTRKPLANVNVFALPMKEKAVTDSKGHFQFSALPEGDVELVVNIADYMKFSQTLKVPFTEPVLKLYIEKNKYQAFETTVTDLRNKKDDSQKRLSQEEFLQMPGSGGDPVKAVQNLPGVSRTGGGDARVIIQGSEPEDTRYNIDGHEVPLIFHFGGLNSIVTPEAVSSVDYYSAGYGPEYGRALGGHVGLNVRKPQTDRVHGMAFQDIYNVGGLIEGPVGENGGYLISGRYSYLGLVMKQAAKDNKDFNLVVAPTFYDFNAQYDTKLNDKEDLRVFSILSKDQLEFVLSKPIGNDPKLRGNFDQRTEFYRVIPEWTRQIDDTKKVTASAGIGADNVFFNLDTNYFNSKVQNLSARADFEHQILPAWKYNVGLDSIFSWYKINVRVPTTFSEGGVANPFGTGDLREADVSGSSNVLGAYWRNEWKPTENSAWTILPNLRVDSFSATKETLLEPRLALRYAYDQSLLLRAATGLYYQEPTGQEIDKSYGNPDVKSERSEHFALGFDKDFREGGSIGYTFGTTLFYKNLERMIVSSGTLVERDGTLTPENYNNDGKGHIQGLEAQLKYKGDTWGVIGSYTYTQSRRQRPGEAELPSPHDQTHSLNLLASYEQGSWHYGARLRYVTGNPYTPIVNSYYDADNDVYWPQRGDLYSARNKDFFQLDLRVDRKWVFDAWILSGYIDIQNLTGYKNQEGLSYSYDYSQKQEITGLPMVPTIGVKGEF
jgi:hypothetical protein